MRTWFTRIGLMLLAGLAITDLLRLFHRPLVIPEGSQEPPLRTIWLVVFIIFGLVPIMIQGQDDFRVEADTLIRIMTALCAASYLVLSYLVGWTSTYLATGASVIILVHLVLVYIVPPIRVRFFAPSKT